MLCIPVNIHSCTLVSMPQQADPNPLLDVKSLAGYLRVSKRTLENLLTRGEGPPYLRLGRQRRWRHADVEVWLKERTHQSKTCESQAS